jgi:hypothetical protein
MKLPCPSCNGLSGSYTEKDEWLDCPDCDESGDIERCVSIADFPKHWRNLDELEVIKADANACKTQHARLLELNPRAKESYDNQLAETLRDLNSKADKLTP